MQYLGAIVIAAALSYLLVWAIRPLLLRFALAKPNARSSHRVPTPQGAGVAVITATIAVSAMIAGSSGLGDANTLTILLYATFFMTSAPYLYC
jgi:UDP-N-acetylmuramyl pentapeptide phosphotransferase/UDP-N-acetylglucosamine-1-phosphate transferase